MTDLFTPPTGDQPVDVLEYAKTKFKNEQGELDVEGLAKGKYEADLAVAQREQELSELREELNERLNLQKLVDDLRTAQEAGTPESGTPNLDAQVPQGTKTLSDEELKSKMTELLNEQKQKEVLERNVAFVRDELIKTYGSNYEQKVMARANELGVDRKFIESMAMTQPKAFLELVSRASNQQSDPNAMVPPRTTVASAPAQVSGRNYAYYQKIKETNPREYWSPRVQLEAHRQAQRMGPSFYNK